MDQKWIDQYFFCDGHNTERLFKIVDRFVNEQKASNTILPLRRSFKSEIISDYKTEHNKKRDKYDAVNKILHQLILKTFRLLSKISPILYSKIFQ